MSDKETADAIVAQAIKIRADLGDLDKKIQGQIDEIVMTAAREGRPLSDADKTQRDALREQQSNVEDAFDELAFATLSRLDQSADVDQLKGSLATINATLTDDLGRLQNIARYAETAANVADGLAQLAAKVAAFAV
jgi:hypothetical protein